MSKTIGFIDYYIDEWHAQNYPAFIKQSPLGVNFSVKLAWDKIAPPGKMPLDEFCKKHNIGRARSIEQVIAECDCLIVLSPDNAEMHEELADLPLRSGKPVYIDKPIAPSLAAARRLFDKASAHKTPMFSSSALRFGSAVESAIAGPMKGLPARVVSTRGGGKFEVYAIHQIEMAVMAMGVGAKRAMQTGTSESPIITFDYGGDRRAIIHLMPGHPFHFSALHGDAASPQCVAITEMPDFFPRFIDAMLRFFETGTAPVKPEQTLEIAAMIEAGDAAMRRPGVWVDVPRG